MRQFIKTSVPTNNYCEVKNVGEKYIVHLEPIEDQEIESTTCYECVVNSQPDIASLNNELQEWKSYILQKELAVEKKIKMKEILMYDSSNAVNSFEITKDGQKFIDYWIPRDLRTSLEGDVKAAKTVGNTYMFDVRELGITLELNCDKFLNALTTLRQYAYTAYNVTSQHLSVVLELETVEEVKNYDFTVGYPSKLSFEINELAG